MNRLKCNPQLWLEVYKSTNEVVDSVINNSAKLALTIIPKNNKEKN